MECIGRTANFDRRIENFEYAPRTDQRLLNAIRDRGDLIHLPRKLLQQSGEYHKAGAEGQSVMHDQPATVAEQDHHIYPSQKSYRGREQTDAPKNRALLIEDRLIATIELRTLFGFAAKRLGHLNSL